MKIRKNRYYIPATMSLCPIDMLDTAANDSVITREELSDRADHVLNYFECYRITQGLHPVPQRYTVKQMASHIHFSRMAMESAIIELVSQGYLGAPDDLKVVLIERKQCEKQGGRGGILNGLNFDHAVNGKECMA